MADHALGFELRQHGAHGGIGRRIAEPLADLLGVGAVAEGVEDVHDFAFAAAEFFSVAWVVLRTQHSATNVARQVARRWPVYLLGRIGSGLQERP